MAIWKESSTGELNISIMVEKDLGLKYIWTFLDVMKTFFVYIQKDLLSMP